MCCLGMLLALASIVGADDKPVQLKIEVHETAGIRRFGYPVNVVARLTTPAPEKSKFRLLKGNQPVSAQIAPIVTPGKGIELVYVDFALSCSPLEKGEYVLEYGSAVTAGPVQGQMLLTESKEHFLIKHGATLEFAVPRELSGLLSYVRNEKLEYLREKSPGLFAVAADGKKYGDLKATGKVVRNGPAAASLQFEKSDFLGLGKDVVSTVELHFPRSKSWVEVRWTVDDPQGQVRELGADFNLNIADDTTLIDFGAGSFVYVHLKKGQAARMRAGTLSPEKKGPLWETFSGTPDKWMPYVVAPSRPGTPDAEGWAHVMDKQRCTAIAVAGFAQSGQEAEITTGADGTLQILRRWSKGDSKPMKGRKTLTFWLHFVPMPVHVGALTSPQAMLAPFEIRVGK